MMNTDLDILLNLINDNAIVTVEKNPYNRNFLQLYETGDGNSEDYHLKVLNTPEDTIAIKSDMFPPPKNVFQNTKGECKRGDFVIISEDVNCNWIIYIEMKYGKHGESSRIIQQLKGSKCFIDYCRSIGRTFFGQDKFLDDRIYVPRYVSVKNINSRKRPTFESYGNSLHNCPEKMLKISNPSDKGIYFSKLIQSLH